jgi:ATP-binding cassette, subfamily F, member 3
MAHPLVEGTKIRKAYGLQVVLEDLSFLISEKQKIALIGRNGAGKSTFLKILTGKEQEDGGNVRFYERARIGVVEQHEVLPSDRTVLEHLTAHCEKHEWEIRKQASQFGLKEKEMAMAPALLSGGYQMRVKLVAMLLQDPNLLLLDEPVNYLDLQTLLLLERFLQNYSGGFIVAAHDRTFLQNTCTTTFEIERGKLTAYKGGVQDFLSFKTEQLEYELRSNKKLAREIAHQQKFVDRFRFKASMASRAQSKVKHIAKLRNRISSVDTALATTKIAIPSPHFVPGTAVHVQELSVGYGDLTVVEKIDFEIMRGDKVVIAGENGRGKSTLLKTLAGKIEPLSGRFKWWHKSDIGYFDQHTEKTLKRSETVLQYLTRTAPSTASSERLLMMAGNFLFKNDDLDKPTSVLSGGERARLCLAGVLLHEYNVLLLDEPTNHLDVETTEALAVALKEYEGTVIVISHARTFINTLVDRVFEIRGGTLRKHLGSYENYVDDVAALMEAETEVDDTENAFSILSSQMRAELHTRIKEFQRSQERAGKLIKKLEIEKSEIHAYFFEHPTDYAPPKAQRLGVINEELEELEITWLKDQEQIDAFREQL